VPARVCDIAGTLAYRGQLQRALAARYKQPWLIKEGDLCPKCKEPLYGVNNAAYDVFLIHRCPFCGYDLHLPEPPEKVKFIKPRKPRKKKSIEGGEKEIGVD